MTAFIPTSAKLFFSKNDPDDLRLGDLVKNVEMHELAKSDGFCIMGYPDDTGIKLNNGRTGAAAAPTTIRQYLYKMTPTVALAEFFDGGDLVVVGELGERHHEAQQNMLRLQSEGVKTISLGGGHDYGFPDASGFLKACLTSGRRPLVLNFDAHLDVRPVKNGLNSGTPFFRLLSEFEGRFDFAEIGIQPQCNSLKHREWALAKGAHLFDLQEINQNHGLDSLFQHSIFSNLAPETPVFVSFDIDCLTSTEAPGCSQSWVTGLKTQNFLTFLSKLCQRADVRGLGIYEVSPPLDLHDQTAKTAALIAYHFLTQSPT